MAGAAALDPRIVAGADYGNPDPEWTRVDWPAASRTVELDGATVRYVELGEGEPVLFVHGISGCWQNWLENLPHVAATGRRAIALDLPGFGASPMPAWPVEMAAYGRVVNELCAHLGLERVTLVGNSMGGFVAVEAATADPRRYRHLVLVSAAGIINTWNPEGRATLMALIWSQLGPLAAGRSAAIVARPRSRRLVWAPMVRYPSRLRGELLLAQMESGLRCPAFGPALSSLIAQDIRERLGSIALPTLIVWGQSDRVIPLAAGISYHRRIPHSRLEVFERTGHLPQLERPLRFNALLDELPG